MKLYAFDLSRATLIERFDSHGVAAHPMVHITAETRLTCMYITPMGVVGMHAAHAAQLFCVVSGHGWVRTAASDPIPISAGYGAYWEAGEEHESGTDEGMTVMILEGSGWSPDTYLTEIM